MEKLNNIKEYFSTFRSRMNERSSSDSFREFALALLVTSPVFILLLYIFLPVAPSDWSRMFYVVPKIPLHPYQIPSYNYPPWLTIILFPFSIFSLRFSQALNAFAAFFFLSLLIARYKGNWVSFLLTFTSVPFLSMLGNVNVDWIVAVAFVFPSIWTLPFALVKPQVGVLAILVWFKRSENKVAFILFLVLFLLATLLIWRDWPLLMWKNISGLSLGHINSSFFPWSVPIGASLLYHAWKKEDELAAVGATLCMMPYFAWQSLIVGFAILAARYKKIALVVWILLWIDYFV